MDIRLLPISCYRKQGSDDNPGKGVTPHTCDTPAGWIRRSGLLGASVQVCKHTPATLKTLPDGQGSPAPLTHEPGPIAGEKC